LIHQTDFALIRLLGITLPCAPARTAPRAQAEGQTTAQRQQRIQDEAAKRAALARPDPRYKPIFPARLPTEAA
jgi:hypothetical protein